jgi:hypothetical protein
VGFGATGGLTSFGVLRGRPAAAWTLTHCAKSCAMSGHPAGKVFLRDLIVELIYAVELYR